MPAKQRADRLSDMNMKMYIRVGDRTSDAATSRIAAFVVGHPCTYSQDGF